MNKNPDIVCSKDACKFDGDKCTYCGYSPYSAITTIPNATSEMIAAAKAAYVPPGATEQLKQIMRDAAALRVKWYIEDCRL